MRTPPGAEASKATRSAIAGIALSGTLFAALVAQGANSAALAALFGCGLSIMVAAAALVAPGVAVRRFFRRNIPGAIALALFSGYCIATIIPNAVLPPHPFWAQTGAPAGAASLAPFRTVEGLVSLIVPVAAYAAAAMATPTPTDRNIFFRTLVWLTIPFCIYTLAIYATGIGSNHRVSVNFGSPNSAALAFAILGLFSATELFRGATRRRGTTPMPLGPLAFAYHAPAATIALVLSLACLLLTASRAGMLAAAGGGVLLLTLLLVKREGGQLRYIVPVIGVLASMFVFAGGEFAFRRFADASLDLQTRGMLIGAHWEAFVQRPLFGHGLNTFHEINAQIATPANWTALQTAGSAHNIYVQLLEEAGIVGAVLLTLAVLPALLRVSGIALSNRSGADWSSAVIAATTVALIHGLLDFGLQTPAIAALIAAGLGACNHQARQSRAALATVAMAVA